MRRFRTPLFIFALIATFAWLTIAVCIGRVVYWSKFHLKIVNHAQFPLTNVVAVFCPKTQFPVRVALGDLNVESEIDKDVDGAEGDLVMEYTYDGRPRTETIGYVAPGSLLQFEVNRDGTLSQIGED